jgi:diguanylate cyclase
VDNRSDIAARALERLRAFGIPPTPPHFAVWFSYYAGENPELKRAVDAALAGSEPMNEAVSRSLYDRFFQSNDPFDDQMDLAQRIETSAGQVLAALGAASADAERYGNMLENFSGGITKSLKGNDIAQMIKGLIDETKLMQQHNKALRSEVESSSARISQLKNNLATARRDAITDPLTGLRNRKAFDHAMRTEAGVSEDTGEPLTLLLCDIDHFKKVNDTYGHQVGDQVLKLVASTILQCIKGQDIAARYGGEEFAVILPHTNVIGGTTVAETIRRTVESKKIVRRGTNDTLGTVTMSFGVAALAPGESHESLIERADRALYVAKKSGRNRISTDKGIQLQNAANG